MEEAMIKNIKKFCLFFLTPCIFLLGQAEHPFALLTIPKAGSHLMIKALYFMTGVAPVWHTHFPSIYYLPPDQGFLYTHLCVSPELQSNYDDLPDLRKIVTIRDLRDVCVSMVHQIEKNVWPGMSLSQRQAFKRMSFDEKLLFVIGYDYDVQQVAGFAPNSLQVSIEKVAKQAVDYSMHSDSLVCKYENLVGPLGEGSEEAQHSELRKIADYLEVPMEEEALQEIAQNLYGDEVNPFNEFGASHFRSTFHSGKIGSWKAFFKEEHKEAFKEKLGGFLIALGYEKDNSW